MPRRELADHGNWWSWGEAAEDALRNPNKPDPDKLLTPEQQIAIDEAQRKEEDDG